MTKRLIAIIFIYICTVIAWMILGSTVLFRTNESDSKLKGYVGQLWGTSQTQQSPSIYYETTQKVENKRMEGEKVITELQTQVLTHYVPLLSSKINTGIKLEYRRKGLLWYSTYAVAFQAVYTFANDTGADRDLIFNFNFPTEAAIYDDFHLKLDGEEEGRYELSGGVLRKSLPMPAGQSKTVEVAYKSQGMDQWWYSFGGNVSQVKDFTLTMNTDFDEIDFPQNSISPTAQKKTDKGWELTWKYTSLLTGVQIALEMPHKLNPGPWVSKVTFSAPISLFLFFFLLFVITALRRVKIHPMNYFFIGAGYFSFHLLMAYIVDHLSIHTSFLISAAVSIFLVVSYMRLVVGLRFAFFEIALSQFVYLVLFSYTFFFEGYTGLAITVLGIATLFVVMQITGRVDWETVFRKESAAEVNQIPHRHP